MRLTYSSFRLSYDVASLLANPEGSSFRDLCQRLVLEATGGRHVVYRDSLCLKLGSSAGAVKLPASVELHDELLRHLNAEGAFPSDTPRIERLSDAPDTPQAGFRRLLPLSRV